MCVEVVNYLKEQGCIRYQYCEYTCKGSVVTHLVKRWKAVVKCVC